MIDGSKRISECKEYSLCITTYNMGPFTYDVSLKGCMTKTVNAYCEEKEIWEIM